MSHLARLLRQSFWLLLSLTILAPGLAAAEVLEERQLIEDKLPHIEKILLLQPLLETEVLIQDFQATFLSNGSVKLSGRGQARAGAPTAAIEFEIDLIQGTYRTRKVEAQEIADSLLGADDFVTVKIQTRDPLFLALTQSCQDLRASYHRSIRQSISICGRNDAQLTYRWSHIDSREWVDWILGWIIVG